jgi:hypothetical protein
MAAPGATTTDEQNKGGADDRAALVVSGVPQIHPVSVRTLTCRDAVPSNQNVRRYDTPKMLTE